MAFVAIGALIGAISVGGGAYLFGATLLASMMVGASIGAMFESTSLDVQSPTYSIGPVQNSKTQMLPIPIVYGRCRLAGNIFYEKFLDDDKTKVDRMIGISEGPVEQISEVRVDDKDPVNDLEGCSYTVHLNTDGSTTDPRDPDPEVGSGLPGFIGNITWPDWWPLNPVKSDIERAYPNDIAFIGLSLKAQKELSGPATCTSIVEGRTVWTPEGIMFSRNPAWIIRDYLTNERYGLGVPLHRIDEASFVDVANYCDELVEGEPRFTLDLVIDTYRHGPDILADMLSCFRGYLVKRDKIELRVDSPVSTASKAIGLDNILEGSFTWWQSPDEEALNRIIVEWVDPENHWERTTAIFEDSADIAVRGVVEQTFSLLGITRSEQVARMGAYLIDSSQGIRNFCSFNLSLKDADVEVGDVIALTHDLPGWTGKWMRVQMVTDTGDTEDITVVCSEYVAEVYNDVALDYQDHIDTNLPNPFECPNVTNMDAAESIQVHPDGPVMSNIDVTWTDPSVLLSGVEVSILEEGDSIWKVLAVVPEGTEGFVIRNVRADQTVTVRVRAINEKGITASGVTKGLVLYGKSLPPGVPTGLATAGGPGMVTVSWANPTDADLGHVEILEYKGTAQPADPSEGTLVASIAGTSLTRGGLDELQTYWYWIRAVDTSGNASAWVGPMSVVTTMLVGEGSITETEIADDSISTPKLQANAVTAQKINVANLSAIAGDFGIITAGIAKSTDDKFIIDLTNRVIEIYEDVVRMQVLTEVDMGDPWSGNIRVTLNDGSGAINIDVPVNEGYWATEFIWISAMSVEDIASRVAVNIDMLANWNAFASGAFVAIRHVSGIDFTYSFTDLDSTGVTVAFTGDNSPRVRLGYLGT